MTYNWRLSNRKKRRKKQSGRHTDETSLREVVSLQSCEMPDANTDTSEAGGGANENTFLVGFFNEQMKFAQTHQKSARGGVFLNVGRYETEQQQQHKRMLRPFKAKTDAPVPAPARSWSAAASVAFWVGLVLLVGVLIGLAYIGIRSLTEINQLESEQLTLTADIDYLTNTTSANVTSIEVVLADLQALVSQAAVTLSVNGTNQTLIGPGVGVTLTVPGYGMVYRTVPDPFPAPGWQDLVWDTALWDDAGYWDASQPAQVFLPATGRYAVGLRCPTCCLLDTTTYVEGTVTVVYSTATEPFLHCPTLIAAQDVWGNNPPIATVPSVNIYFELEMQGGNGEFLAVEPQLLYQPSQPPTPQGGPDDCVFTVRYLRAAVGTPLVPRECFKRREAIK